MKIENKIIVVTGSSSGIGREIAIQLLKKRALVIGISRSKVPNDIIDIYENYKHYNIDISNEEMVKELADHIYKKYERIDVLVNSAGILNYTTPNEQFNNPKLNENFKKLMDVNFFGNWYCMQYFGNYMKNNILDKDSNNKGVIINISSSAIFDSSNISYRATKCALSSLTKPTSYLLAKDKIRVLSICPGVIETSMTKDILDKEMDAYNLVDRPGNAEEIAHSVIFIISNEYINSIDLAINGGLKQSPHWIKK